MLPIPEENATSVFFHSVALELKSKPNTKLPVKKSGGFFAYAGATRIYSCSSI